MIAKTEKRYKCPYCDFRGSKNDLTVHIEDHHEEMIPKGFTAARVVFNYIYRKTSGICVVCKRPTEWNDDRGKYERLCGRKQCAEALHNSFVKNMIKVFGKPTLLDDPEHQEKMLANRGISGKYKFEDGGVHIYTGTYEKKLLEFLDKVMHYKSSEILSPGPVFEYEFEGKKLKWITDLYIIPYNLIIEVKDGGSNPNNRSMPSYRAKQDAKETMLTSMGKFNYLRLTDNNFEQLIDTLAEMKMQMIDDSAEDKKVVININEEVGALNEAKITKDFNGIKMAMNHCLFMAFREMPQAVRKSKANKKTCLFPPEARSEFRKGQPAAICRLKKFEYIKGVGSSFQIIQGCTKWINTSQKGFAKAEAKTENGWDILYVTKMGKVAESVLNESTDMELLAEFNLFKIFNGEHSYPDARAVYDSLSDDDKKLCSPNGEYTNNPACVWRWVAYDKSKPVGFIDLNKYNGSDDAKTVFVVCAVSPEYRRDGLATIMLKKAVKAATELGYKKLMYSTDEHNKPSIAVAEKFGFDSQTKTGSRLNYYLELNKKEKVNEETVIQEDGEFPDIEKLAASVLRGVHRNSLYKKFVLSKSKDEKRDLDERILRSLESKINYIRRDWSQHHYAEKALISACVVAALVGVGIPAVASSAVGAFAARNTVKALYSENMGLAAATGGAMVGTTQAYVTQYTMPNTFTNDSKVDGYAISNDIISKRAITKDKSTGKLVVKETEELFKDRRIKVFKCNLSEESRMLLVGCIGEEVSDGFVYELATGKRLFSDDQLDIDPMLEEVDPELELAKTSSEVQTIFSELASIRGIESSAIPVMGMTNLNEAAALTKGRKDVTVFESVNGFYAENVYTRKRTAISKSISEIKLEVL